MKIFIYQPQYSKIAPWDKNKTARIISLLKNSNCKKNGIQLTKSPEKADLIVMLESPLSKSIEYSQKLLEDNKIKLKPFRVYTINYEDHPTGLIPGIYSSLELHNFKKKYHISYPHLDFPNEYVEIYSENNTLPENHFLFTFSGSCSHSLRKTIFSAYSEKSNLYKVVESKKWYNHSDDEKRNYVKDIINSKYVLCPRGIASYSHRIIETIALGRVPVIIANNWVPFSIPEDGYYLKINENDICFITELLKQWEICYEDIVKNVKYVYRKYFSPNKRYLNAILKILDLHSSIKNNNIEFHDFTSLLHLVTKDKL